MKKTKMINSELSYTISKMGHTDSLTIGDCGLPIPDEVKRIDLALTHNVPTFIQTLDVVLEAVSYTHLDVYKRQLLWSI